MSWTVDSLTYSHRKKITIDNTKVDAALSDFPVLVYLNADAQIGAVSNADGFDIRFTSSDGETLLKYERENFAIASNQATANFWVKIPSVSSSADTEFYIYYRNADTADGADPANVWDSNFVAVHHLVGANKDALDDSTSNNNDVTAEGGTPGYNTDAKIGKGVELDGVNEFVTIPDSDSLDVTSALTMEILVESDVVNTNDSLINKFWDGGKRAYAMHRENDEIRIVMGDPNGGAGTGFVNFITTDLDLLANTWYHIVLRWSATGGTGRIYKNGVVSAQTFSKSNNIGTNSQVLNIGYETGAGTGTTYLDGIIDEVRISNTERSVAWIKATYNSNFNTLLSLGSEEGPVATRRRAAFMKFF